MEVVMTYGTFDVLHYGHINLLKRARALGDYLIVACSSDEFNALKKKKALYTYEQRKMMLESVRYVDLVVMESGWEQKLGDVAKYNVSILAMGSDWRGKFDFLSNVCRVVYLGRTPCISSTETRDYLFKTHGSALLWDL
jgi:glycerol-3-phosphate cytidylyltransferase